jgi:dTDP-4-dehydrorhamnose 3,5-epimerase
MQVTPTPFDGLFIIQPKIFADERGYFFESYNFHTISKFIEQPQFVQDNQSLSQKNVLRGLHFQNPPHSQIKLVQVVKGAVLDVVVDIRKESKTYGKHFKIVLDEKNKTQLWVPEGFAHGFCTLEDNTIFQYKCSKLYNKDSEDSVMWNDLDLGIDWGVQNPIISEKDKFAKAFKSFKSLF